MSERTPHSDAQPATDREDPVATPDERSPQTPPEEEAQDADALADTHALMLKDTVPVKVCARLTYNHSLDDVAPPDPSDVDARVDIGDLIESGTLRCQCGEQFQTVNEGLEHLHEMKAHGHTVN